MAPWRRVIEGRDEARMKISISSIGSIWFGAAMFASGVIGGCSGSNPGTNLPQGPGTNPGTMPAMNPGMDPAMMMPGQMPPANAVTFHKDVEPLLQDHCQGCHRPDGIAPFALMTYADAQRWAQPIALETAARRMPPWGESETDACHPRFRFRDDVRLASEEIKAIADWVDQGALEGDPSAAPPPKDVAHLRALSRVDAEMQPDKEWVTSGTRDQFRCFVLDPHWTTDQYVNGMNFIAGNPKVTHHAIAFLDPHRESSAMVDPATGSYECFGAPNVTDTSILMAWAPGVPPAELGDQVALQVPANALIVLQIHYHPLGSSAPEHDRSTLQLRTSDARPPWVMDILLIGNFQGALGTSGDGLLPGPDDRNGTPEFRIPAGATAHTEEMQFTLPAMRQGVQIPDLKVLSVGTHMHYVGTDMMFSFDHAAPKAGEPASECMLETPHWDFHWQRGYAYDVSIETAPEWRPHDKLFMKCTYNNSMDNPAVAAALAEQGLSAPRDVVLGEQTLDEMCLAAISIAYRNPF
jgi:hypothetical protein